MSQRGLLLPLSGARDARGTCELALRCTAFVTAFSTPARASARAYPRGEEGVCAWALEGVGCLVDATCLVGGVGWARHVSDSPPGCEYTCGCPLGLAVEPVAWAAVGLTNGVA